MFNSIKIYLTLAAVSAILGGVSYAVNEYANMRIDLQNAKTELVVVKGNVEVAGIVKEAELAIAVDAAVAEERRQQLIKEMKNDTSTTVTIDSCRYYLTTTGM